MKSLVRDGGATTTHTVVRLPVIIDSSIRAIVSVMRIFCSSVCVFSDDYVRTTHIARSSLAHITQRHNALIRHTRCVAARVSTTITLMNSATTSILHARRVLFQLLSHITNLPHDQYTSSSYMLPWRVLPIVARVSLDEAA